MLYRMIPQKYVVFSYSNTLITKILKIKYKSIPYLFTIDTIDKLERIFELYLRIFNKYRENKDLELILAPTFGNWYSINCIQRGAYAIIPNSILLLLRRPRPTDPFDTSLFIDDVKTWFNRLLYALPLAKSFIPIFIYDITHLFNTLVEYIPLALINKEGNIGKNVSTCCHETLCTTYVEDHGDFIVLLNLWHQNTDKDFLSFSYRRPDVNISQVCNPLFNSNPFICKQTECIQQCFPLNTSSQINYFNKLIIEFTTSYIITMSEDFGANNFTYLWFAIPSANYIAMFGDVFKHLSTYNLLVIDIINNNAEFGSINIDRIWINILKHITNARKVKVIVGY